MTLNILKFLGFCFITAALFWLLDVKVGEIARESIIRGYEIGLKDCQKQGGSLPYGDTRKFDLEPGST